MSKEAKSKLKCKKVVSITVDAYDLEEFIRKVYGIPYEVVAEEEWSNDSSHRFSISSEDVNDSFSEWDLDVMKKFLSGKSSPYSLRVILVDMAKKGFIEVGNYLVTVSW